MQSVFTTSSFEYPYRHLKFPGQHSEEKILFITREGKTMLYLRWLVILIGTAILLIIRQASRPLIEAITPGVVTSCASRPRYLLPQLHHDGQ